VGKEVTARQRAVVAPLEIIAPPFIPVTVVYCNVVN
jgi:hypothetical protein